jgi:hypothetical protein
MKLTTIGREEDGHQLPVACWHPGPGYWMISNGVLCRASPAHNHLAAVAIAGALRGDEQVKHHASSG